MVLADDVVIAKEIVLGGKNSYDALKVKANSGNDVVVLQADANGHGQIRLRTSANSTKVLLNGENGACALGAASLSADAILACTSTTQGVLLPRMTTTQRDAISSPTAGLLIYNTTTNKLNFRAAAAWEAVTSA